MDAERDTWRTALLDECFQQKSRWACMCVCVCVVCVCVYVCVCVSWMQNETLGGLHCWMSVSNKSLDVRVCVCVCVCQDAERETRKTALLDECFQQICRWACVCMCDCVCVCERERECVCVCQYLGIESYLI